MDEQKRLDLGDATYTNQMSARCPCGCDRAIALFDTNPQNAGNRPFVSAEGVKIWLAAWSCVDNALAACERKVVAQTGFKSVRTTPAAIS